MSSVIMPAPPDVLALLMASSISLKVSKTWLQTLTSLSSLWSHIDFSEAKKSVSQSIFRSHVFYSRGRATSAVLKGLSVSALSSLDVLTKRNPRLDTLELVNGGELGLPLARSLALAANLRRLSLSGRTSSIASEAIHTILVSCPSLTSIQVANLHSSYVVQRHINVNLVHNNLKEVDFTFSVDTGGAKHLVSTNVPWLLIRHRRLLCVSNSG